MHEPRFDEDNIKIILLSCVTYCPAASSGARLTCWCLCSNTQGAAWDDSLSCVVLWMSCPLMYGFLDLLLDHHAMYA